MQNELDAGMLVVDKDDVKRYSLDDVLDKVIWGDALKVLKKLPAESVDLVFMDPPYNKNTIAPVLTNLQHSGCLRNGAMVVIEHCLQEPVPEKRGPFRLSDQRKYRKTLVSFMNYML